MLDGPKLLMVGACIYLVANVNYTAQFVGQLPFNEQLSPTVIIRLMSCTLFLFVCVSLFVVILTTREGGCL